MSLNDPVSSRRSATLRQAGTVVIIVSLALVLLAYLFNSGATPARERLPNEIVLTADWYAPVANTLEQQAQNRPFELFMQAHPQVRIEPWVTLPVEGAATKSGRLMAVAGGMAPDLWRFWFHEVIKAGEQNFLLPLNKYIGDDLDGDGEITGDEVRYAPWHDIPDYVKRGCVVDGQIYALPYDMGYYQSLVYRRDLFLKVGLDPDAPPERWDDLYERARRLTFKAGERADQPSPQWGMYVVPQGYMTFNPLVWSAGGDLVRRVKVCPNDGQPVTAAQEQELRRCPRCDADLRGVEEQWQAAFDSPESLAAMRFLYRLRWQKWAKCPTTAEPFDLDDEAIRLGRATSPFTGETFALNDSATGNVYTGVLYVGAGGGQEQSTDLWHDFANGRFAMVLAYTSQLLGEMGRLGLSPEQCGIAPPPAAEGQPIVVNTQPLMFGIGRRDDRSEAAEQAAWSLLAHVTSRASLEARVRLLVDGGAGALVHPPFLEAAGYHELYRSLPATWRNFEDRIERKRTEPFNNGWTEVQTEVTPAVVQRILREPNVDVPALLATATREADARFGGWSEQELAQVRPWAWFGVVAVVALMIPTVVMIIRSLRATATAKRSTAGLPLSKLNYLWLLPALLTILVWSYYPLARGSVMAMQDYRIGGGSTWVGVDNFIVTFANPMFYRVMFNTLYYAALTILIGFFTPALLAVLLTEIKRFRYLFRTIFYLPSVTSGLVILFLWKRFYEPTADGLLNQLLISLCGWLGIDFAGFHWLEDPRLAMLCVIVPGVWASAGAGSLIYQAALVSVPAEMYEAAELDGAGTFQKLRHITYPTLKPLLIINFVGVFIGCFHAMQNIFVMTGGGPDNATRVIGLDIWFNAFLYLRFGLATAMAWILGVMLIGFTLWQLRILNKVEFRRAGA